MFRCNMPGGIDITQALVLLLKSGSTWIFTFGSLNVLSPFLNTSEYWPINFPKVLAIFINLHFEQRLPVEGQNSQPVPS